MIREFKCNHCGYEGICSEGPDEFSLTVWVPKVCNKNKEFVEVNTKFHYIDNPAARPTDEELKAIEADFNRCPIHHDQDLSEVRYDQNNIDVLCPKCENAMSFINFTFTD